MAHCAGAGDEAGLLYGHAGACVLTALLSFSGTHPLLQALPGLAAEVDGDLHAQEELYKWAFRFCLMVRVALEVGRRWCGGDAVQRDGGQPGAGGAVSRH